MTLLLLLTTLSCAPQVAMLPRPPVIVIPVVAVTDATLKAVALVIVACFPFSAVATSPVPVIATEATLKAELVVNVFCFVPTAAEIRVMMSVPPR